MGLIAIDPGTCSGYAYFEKDMLKSCGVFEKTPPYLGPSLVVIERPQIYVSRPVNSNDLITLAILVGRLSAQYELQGCEVEYVVPHGWKGTLDKDMCWRRTKPKLSPEELHVLPKVAKTYTHNMYDAIGIGLWKLDR